MSLPFFFQVLADFQISIFDVHAFELEDFLGEASTFVDGTRRIVRPDHFCLETGFVVLCSEGGGLMDNACAGVAGHVGGADHLKTAIFLPVDKAVIQRLVLQADQLHPLAATDYLIGLFFVLLFGI